MARKGARSERRMARNRFFAWFGLVWFEVLLSLLGLSKEMFKSDEVK